MPFHRSTATGAGASIVRWPSCILAASVGDYEIVSAGEGECAVVLLRWKEQPPFALCATISRVSSGF
jgi:hypothetical protein